MGGLDPPIQSQQHASMPKGYVYILASRRNGTIYTGVTTNSAARTYAHREGNGSNFAKNIQTKC